LSIDENSLFEGSSRRVENPADLPSVDAKGPRDEDMLAPYLQRVEASASTEWSAWTVEPKHWGCTCQDIAQRLRRPADARCNVATLLCDLHREYWRDRVVPRRDADTGG
jgi:hypothetical protein